VNGIELRFEEDAYTAIFEIDPFEIWKNLTDSPTLTRYMLVILT